MAGWLIFGPLAEFKHAISGVASGWVLLERLERSHDSLEWQYLIQRQGPMWIAAHSGFGLCDGVVLNSKAALRFNSALVVLKFSALALFILVGLFHFSA